MKYFNCSNCQHYRQAFNEHYPCGYCMEHNGLKMEHDYCGGHTVMERKPVKIPGIILLGGRHGE